MSPPVGVALTGHWLSLEAVRRLARRADRLGYAVVLVDGDSGLLARRPRAPVWATSALSSLALQATQRARVGALRLPAFWNPVLLARDLATLQEIGEGRALGFFGVGAARGERRLGLEPRTARERIRLLDETLQATRGLLAGERVTLRGEFVDLEEAFVPPPRAPIPLVVAAAGPRALRIACRHADVLDANVPPLVEHLGPLRERIPGDLETWIWIFTRPGASPEAAARSYRRLCPWFSFLREESMQEAVLWGEPARCRDRLAAMWEKLGVDMPVLDLAGLDEAAADRALGILAPAKAGDFS